MEFTNLAAELETGDTIEAFGETPFEEKSVVSSPVENRAKSENLETEKHNGVKGLIRGKFKNFSSRTCIIVLLIVLIVLILSTVTTVVTVYAPCNGNGEGLVGRERCDANIQIEKGKVFKLKGTQHGDTAEIDCEAGHKLVGAKVITCSSTNNWNEVPKCVSKACQQFHVPQNAVVQPALNSTSVGTSFSVSCKDGFKLQGNETVECLHNETWSPVPKCQVYECEMPKELPYATITNLRGTKINDTFDVLCHGGYRTVGDSVVRCKTDGKWSDFPKCLEISCGMPTIPAHGSITFLDGITYNSSVVFNCTDGYRINGSQAAFCGDKGKWTDLPTCQRIKDVNECLSSPCLRGTCLDGVGQYDCSCETGYTGLNCEQDIDDCRFSNCKNGDCFDLISGYNCTCYSGFTGAQCDIEIDECSSNPCLHGRCIDRLASYSCACYSGYNGSNCENNIDECASSPCLHGTCLDGVGQYNCSCESGYTGFNCEQDVDECLSSPCLHGSCLDGVGQYNCSCEIGYTGFNCEHDIDDCSFSKCKYGECFDLIGGYNCTCYPGFTGDTCDTEIDECGSHPCQHGRCIDGLAHYTCSCNHGYDGDNCENNIDECSSSPCLHGTCLDGVGQHSCACESGYTGLNCEQDIDECSSSPCLHGTCLNRVGQYNCSCESGYTGLNCEHDIDDCSFSQCYHGDCIDFTGGYNCKCYPGFSGAHCDKEIDECKSNPCLNGQCIDGLARYTCNCNDGFNGSNCENNIDDCSSSPCLHGSCLDGVEQYSCSCETGYTGFNCEQEIDECSSNPCLHGICIDGLARFTCTCDSGYSGSYCDNTYCDFSTGFCSWIQSNNDTLDWTRIRGRTSSSNTGPNSDVSGFGYYIYTEASINFNSHADLVSSINAKGRPYCFQMYTNMYGANMGSISVTVQDVITNRKVTIASYTQADTSPIWRKRDISIPAQANAFKIILRGNTGSSFQSDAAVDNIRVTDGQC